MFYFYFVKMHTWLCYLNNVNIDVWLHSMQFSPWALIHLHSPKPPSFLAGINNTLIMMATLQVSVFSLSEVRFFFQSFKEMHLKNVVLR